MISKWYESKAKAMEMRLDGESIRVIERKLKIPRSTLSSWFKNIELTKAQRTKLHNNWLGALDKARKSAVIWHNSQKAIRLNEARAQATRVLRKIDFTDKNVMELALAMLYLGEGSKTNLTSMGNSNPLILKFFMKSMNTLFNIKKSDFKCEIHLRSDQSVNKMVKYWSNELGLPTNVFYTIKDKRLAKSKTYENYMGVCVVRCGKIALQRRIVCLSEEFCKEIVNLDP